ncbi:MAG: hypothetical protein LIO74_01555 [Ruminococcus sp.]|nr:hypothetical protein [Ruminococcus sp.]
MRNFSKNKKGFTIAEEVISLLLVSILIVTASGILTSQMRIFARNVITLTAQKKGIAVMDQLVNDLEYATGIGDTCATTSDPYQLILTVDSDGLNEIVALQYSNSNTSSYTTNNLVCKMGNYDALYQLEYNSTNQSIKIDLQVERSGTVYYSEQRTVVLKNLPYVSLSSNQYDSINENKLYISGLE